MKRKRHFESSMPALLIVALVAFGCATQGINLVQNHTASVEIVCAGDEKAFVEEANVYQDGTDLVIEGYVKRKSRWLPPKDYEAHVDMAVLSPDGKLVYKASAGILPMPRVKSLQAPFSARFPFVAAQGTMVRLAYHRFQSQPSQIFDCGQNAAAQETLSE
jgi:hypothetical protein